MNIRLKTDEDIEQLKKSGKILSHILKELKDEAKIGVSLKFLDELARQLLRKADARPAFLGYRPEGARRPYPAAICASINNQIVHGIPSDYTLKKGDILKIDLGVDYKGYFTDGAFSLGIGKINTEAQKLINATKKALEKAIAVSRVGNHLGDIGWSIEKTAKQNGFSVIRGLTGHGIGFKLHEEPSVFNYGNRGEGPILKPGLVLAIETMISAGSGEIKQATDDSFFTRDNSLCAHFEKTIAITRKKPVILTNF